MYSDPCVYINRETGVIIAMWVDDLIIFAKDIISISNLKGQLRDEYEMKDLGELEYVVGIQVHRDREWKIIHINRSGYIRTILEPYGMRNSKPANIPPSAGTKPLQYVACKRNQTPFLKCFTWHFRVSLMPIIYVSQPHFIGGKGKFETCQV